MLDTRVGGDLAEIREKVIAGERLSFEDGIRLFESNEVTRIGQLANLVRERINGNRAYFIHNYRLYPTNICVYKCRFCAFRVSKGDERGYEIPAQRVVRELEGVDLTGVTEFHIVGGIHPDWGFEEYLNFIRAVHEAYPHIHIKAWTGVEIDHFTHLTGESVEWVLERMREAGLGSLPGGGAEIFNWETRRKICRTKCTGERWLEIHETAHNLGMKTNATMLYGHIETPEDKVDHMLRLREVQDRTGGFMTFIPLAFHPENTRLKHIPISTGANDLKHIAISRLMLDNIPHIKAYWVTETVEVAQVALSYGADDLDGTIVVDEEIIDAAGGRHVQGAMTKERFADMIREAGRDPFERDTLYNVVRAY
ncbi:aminofutalosine synthase MqnE [Rubrobacter taiwanensis]|jgi:aminodeoxyfutalosine synthase|uniref:Aminodeoxyfutalosine synthase n=1 Tax=Rubrobacter taiwanensis TaxID=185139 RepID=A0A4R1BS24_9ACTN|nr:aminofutalosine synthase MqnE [Rubrobacter taiwanensis]TCJ20603.1 aminofutalosine synthase MqnE [Rubrobacter taiwanensis]